MRKLRTLTLLASTGAFAIILAACGGSSTAGTSASATVPAGLSVTSFDASYSAMAQLKSLVAAGKGKVAVILPDATTSGRYVTYDQPMLTKAFDPAWTPTLSRITGRKLANVTFRLYTPGIRRSCTNNPNSLV